MRPGYKLPVEFYRRPDVLEVSKDLLGKALCTNLNGIIRKGIIVETEAYAGENDRASHAFGGKRTKRTDTMFGPAGRAYVYLCYGIHHLFNVVTHEKGIPHAVLIRGIEPVMGIDAMREARKHPKPGTPLSYGPGTLTQALGIKTSHDRTDLLGNSIWLEDWSKQIPDEEIQTGPRVGVDYAGEDASLPYRFRINPEILRDKDFRESFENH